MPEATRLSVRDLTPGVVELVLESPLRSEAERCLLDSWGRVTARGANRLLLDLRNAGPVDGNGLAALLKLGCRASGDGQKVHVFGLGLRCRARLNDLHLTELLQIHGSKREAYAAAETSEPSEKTPASDAEAVAAGDDSWAGTLGPAHLPELPEGFRSVNVEGRGVRSPLDGFGQLWSKTYTVRLAGAETDPVRVIDLCKAELGSLWPGENRLYVPPPGVVAGAAGAIELFLGGGMQVSTGVRVLHADESSFTFLTLAGHLEAGWITFSASEDGCTVFQVQSVGRTSDPAYEMGFVLVGHRQQERFWLDTLEALARRYGVPGQVQVVRTCLDRSRHWEKAANLVFNAGARTGLHRARTLVARMLRAGR